MTEGPNALTLRFVVLIAVLTSAAIAAFMVAIFYPASSPIELPRRSAVNSTAGSTPVSLAARPTVQCAGGRDSRTLINRNLVNPTAATGQIEYCTTEAEGFNVAVELNGLLSKTPYTLSLIGSQKEPGNTQLRNVGITTRQGEGYKDFKQLVTDASGAFQEVIWAELPTGEYHVRFLVKDARPQGGYAAVLLDDNVRFTVTEHPAPSPEPAVRIESPIGYINGPRHQVEGKIRPANRDLYVSVLIHPMSTTGWWVQRQPALPNADGSWKCNANFGSEEEGDEEETFEIRAIATPAGKTIRPGAILSTTQVNDLARMFLHSDVVRVTMNRVP